MFLEFLGCSAAVVAAYWYFRKRIVFKRKKIELTKFIPSWSPINILWLDSLPPVDEMSVVSSLGSVPDSYKHNNSVSDQRSWGVLPDDHLSSRLREELDNLSSFPDTSADLVREELDNFPFATSSGEQRDSKHGTEGL